MRAADSSPTHSIVACSRCEQLWIVEELRAKDTAACSLCGQRRATSTLRVIARADGIEQARELRSRLIIDSADVERDPETIGWLALEAETDELGLRDWDRAMAEEVDWEPTPAAELDTAPNEWDRAFEEEIDWDLARDELWPLIESRLDAFGSSQGEGDGEEKDLYQDVDGTGSVTVTDQETISGLVDIEIGDEPPTSVWSRLIGSGEDEEAEDSPLATAIIDAIRAGAIGMSIADYRERIANTSLPLTYDELAVQVAKGNERAREQLRESLPTLGRGQSGLADVHAVLRLLSQLPEPPIVTIRLSAAFFDRRREQRVRICELIEALAAGCDVRIVASGYVRRRLEREHDDELELRVSDRCTTSRSASRTAALVDETMDSFGPDTREVSLLRRIETEQAGSISYHALASEASVSASRIRQCIGALSEAELVETIETGAEKRIELLETGSAFLDALDAEYGVQSELIDCVSETGKPSHDSRVSPTKEEGEGEGEASPSTADGDDDRRQGGLVHPTWMARWRHAAVAGAASEGAISLVDQPQAPSDDHRQPYWSFDEEGDRLIIAAEYVNPMQYWASIARALASHLTFDRVLTAERLNGDSDSDGLAGLITDNLHVLRNARCLGWLADKDADSDSYADRLRTAETDLCRMLSALSRGDYECSDSEYRGQITREAQGLAGTMIHLLDLAGVEVIRELRLPEFTRHFDAERREDLVRTIGMGVAIQSRLGHFSAYRQLYEIREEKRQSAIVPDVDAADPHGELIGSFVLVGQGVDRLESELREGIRETIAGQQLHDDAPEFDVGIPIRSHHGRPAFAQAIREALDGKDLSVTREATALLQALVTTPYDAAKAIGMGLAPETKHPGRDIRIDEVRTALAHGLQASPERLVADAPPSVRKMVYALLGATAPLSQAEFADRAGISARSIRNNEAVLLALGLVRKTPHGYRLALSFDDGERGADAVVPAVLNDPLTSPTDLLFEALQPIVGDAIYDPDHPVGAAFFAPDAVDRLIEADLSLAPWVRIAVGLAGPDEDPPAEPIRFGGEPSQAALSSATDGGTETTGCPLLYSLGGRRET